MVAQGDDIVMGNMRRAVARAEANATVFALLAALNQLRTAEAAQYRLGRDCEDVSAERLCAALHVQADFIAGQVDVLADRYDLYAWVPCPRRIRDGVVTRAACSLDCDLCGGYSIHRVLDVVPDRLALERAAGHREPLADDAQALLDAREGAAR